MKLTNLDRDSFIRAVMNDVPLENFSEKAHALIKAAHEKWLPEPIRLVYADEKLRRQFLKVTYIRHSQHIESLSLYAAEGFEIIANKTLNEKVSELATKSRLQSEKRQALSQKLKSVIHSCNTLKQAQELLPEFVKYLPQDRDGKVTRNVPAVGNLVADLAEAGWPKKEKK